MQIASQRPSCHLQITILSDFSCGILLTLKSQTSRVRPQTPQLKGFESPTSSQIVRAVRNEEWLTSHGRSSDNEQGTPLDLSSHLRLLCKLSLLFIIYTPRFLMVTSVSTLRRIHVHIYQHLCIALAFISMDRSCVCIASAEGNGSMHSDQGH
jgi:hypothetical protein